MTKQKNQIRHKLISGGVTAILIIAIVISLFAFVQVTNNGYVSFFGYSLFRVATGSMEPSIHVGALLLTKDKSIDTIEINDIVSFFSKEAYMRGFIITHRVVDVEKNVTGQVLLTTRGDANSSTDIHRVDEENFIGKVVWFSNEDNIFARLISFLSEGIGFFSCIVIPAVFTSVSIFKSCIKEITMDVKRLREECGYVVDEEASDSQPDLTSLQITDKAELTFEEYEEMCARIRAELTEELKKEDEREH